MGHLAKDASTTEIEFLRQQYMVNCSTWLRDKRSSETRRYASLVRRVVVVVVVVMMMTGSSGDDDDVSGGSSDDYW